MNTLGGSLSLRLQAQALRGSGGEQGLEQFQVDPSGSLPIDEFGKLLELEAGKHHADEDPVDVAPSGDTEAIAANTPSIPDAIANNERPDGSADPESLVEAEQVPQSDAEDVADRRGFAGNGEAISSAGWGQDELGRSKSRMERPIGLSNAPKDPSRAELPQDHLRSTPIRNDHLVPGAPQHAGEQIPPGPSDGSAWRQLEAVSESEATNEPRLVEGIGPRTDVPRNGARTSVLAEWKAIVARHAGTGLTARNFEPAEFMAIGAPDGRYPSPARGADEAAMECGEGRSAEGAQVGGAGTASLNDTDLLRETRLEGVRQEAHFAPAAKQEPYRQVAAVISAEVADLRRLPPEVNRPADPPVVRVLELGLEPQNLGKVHVRLTLSGTRMTVAIKAEQSEVADHIRREHDLLSDMIHAAGVSVDALTVQSGEFGRSTNSGAGPFGTQGAQLQHSNSGQEALGSGPGSGNPSRDDGLKDAPDQSRESKEPFSSERNPGRVASGAIYI